MAIAEALVTLEAYAAMPSLGVATELVEGRIVEVPPPGPEHGRACRRIGMFIGLHVDQHALGEAWSNDSAVVTHRDPDSLRGADFLFYRAAKVPPRSEWKGYFEAPPDLVVEVRSPSDRWPEMVRKALEYLSAGVVAVVLLDPDTWSAHVYRDDQAPRILGPDDTLTFPDLLGDFALRVGAIFE